MSTDLQSGTTRAAGLSTPQAVLAACAVVVTGHLLGVAWLSETVLGLPAGLWVIGLGACVCSASTRRRIAGAVDAAWCLIEPGVRARPRATDAEPNTRGVGWWPRGSVAASIVDASTRAAGAAVRAALVPLWGAEVAYVGSARARAEEWLARLAWPTRPLRIGLRMPADEAEALASAPGAARVEWFDLTSWDDPQAACRRHLLDAVAYHEGEGPVRIVTLERPGHCAGIIEWADLRGELTIASLFPARVDPAAVVVEGATRTRVREGADLLRGLLEAAAALARSAHRLSLADRMLGRRPTDSPGAGDDLALGRGLGCPAAPIMSALAGAARRRAESWPEAANLAAQAASAFFISSPGLAPAERLAGLTAAAGPIADDVTTALRLGAASIGALDDDGGLARMVRADALLRAGAAPLAPLDHAAFLESELVHGGDDPMIVGRAAACICMVCAALPPERIPFVRDDMLEEMAYAGWLVGRDQDRGLLMRVFLEIEHAHDSPAQLYDRITLAAPQAEHSAPAPSPAGDRRRRALQDMRRARFAA